MTTACRVGLFAMVMLAVVGPPPASADPIGPICFSLAPAPNFFVIFLNPSGGNQFSITGRDIAVGDRPISGSAIITGSTFKLGFSLYAVTADQPFSVGSARLDVHTGSWPGFARPLDGVNSSFTLAVAACPPNATQ